MSSLGASENAGNRTGAFSEPGPWHRSVHCLLSLLEFIARGGTHERRIFTGCITPAPFNICASHWLSKITHARPRLAGPECFSETNSGSGRVLTSVKNMKMRALHVTTDTLPHRVRRVAESSGAHAPSPWRVAFQY